MPGAQHEPRFSWWDHKGSEETVQYDFPQPLRVSSVQVWWYDDQPGGGCAVPASWSVAYRAADAWQPVAASSPYGTGSGGFETVTFEPVTSTALQLQVRLQDGKSAGIYEWRVQ